MSEAPYSLFNSKSSVGPFCEIVLLAAFNNAVAVVYEAITEGKLSNPVIGHYVLFTAIFESINFLLIALEYFFVVTYNPQYLLLFFAGSNLITAAFQLSIRWRLSGFMLRGMRRYSAINHLGFISAPFILRVFLIASAAIASTQQYYALNLPSFLIGQMAAFVFDYTVVEYTHLLRLSGQSLSTAQFFKRLMRPQHSMMLIGYFIGLILAHVGYYLPDIQYILASGGILSQTCYYNYRQYLGTHVEGWIAEQGQVAQLGKPDGVVGVKGAAGVAATPAAPKKAVQPVAKRLSG